MTDPRSLHAAALAGDLPGVAAALAAGVPVDASAASGETALMLAAQRGDIACVEALLACGAAVDAITPQGNTALMMAAARGQQAVVVRLVAAGAARERRNKFGLGARDWARWAREPEIVVQALDAS